jgi:hypothetical protein
MPFSFEPCSYAVLKAHGVIEKLICHALTAITKRDYAEFHL